MAKNKKLDQPNQSAGKRTDRTLVILPNPKSFLPFELARMLVQRCRLHTVKDFAKAKLPMVPTNPAREYGKQWQGWEHFLGKPEPTDAKPMTIKIDHLEITAGEELAGLLQNVIRKLAA